MLPLHVWPELLQEILEDSQDHAECLQPLLVIPGMLDSMQPPVLAGLAGPEMMGLEIQEGKEAPGSGILLVSLPGSSQGRWGQGGRCAAASLGQHSAAACVQQLRGAT